MFICVYNYYGLNKRTIGKRLSKYNLNYCTPDRVNILVKAPGVENVNIRCVLKKRIIRIYVSVGKIKD